MREILFRGKCVEVGIYYKRWLEGFYGEDDGKALIAHNTDFGLVGYVCDPDTIGQYTGITDKNGKRIFEGDIVRLNEDYDYGSDNRFLRIPLLVEWDMEMARFKAYKGVLPKGEVCVDTGLELYDDEYEVIGNIHDNPELLEGE